MQFEFMGVPVTFLGLPVHLTFHAQDQMLLRSIKSATVRQIIAAPAHGECHCRHKGIWWLEGRQDGRAVRVVVQTVEETAVVVTVMWLRPRR